MILTSPTIARPTPSPQDYGLTKLAYSINDSLAFLPFGRTKLYELINAGTLKASKCHKNTYILAVDLAAFLSDLPDWKAKP